MQSNSTLCTLKLNFIQVSGPSEVCLTSCTQPSDSLHVVTNVLPFQVLLYCSGSENSACNNEKVTMKPVNRKSLLKLLFPHRTGQLVILQEASCATRQGHRGSNIGFLNPASRRNFSFHPATMKIFIPIPPYQTHVALARR